MFHEFPKALYLRGWDDLDATVTVHDAAEEAAARGAGYRMLSDPPEEPLLAASEAVEDLADAEAPRRRGRPPKAAE